MKGPRESNIPLAFWLMLCLCAAPSTAEPPVLLAQASSPVMSTAARAVPTIMESTRARLVAALARGDVSAAIVAYEADTGRQAPTWLTNLQTAYSAASQVVGKCQEVARTIYMAYDRLDQKPEYIAFRARNGIDYMTFDLVNGKNTSVTRTGYHVAVKVGDLIRDAYTGPLGMKLSDYLARLHAIAGVDWQIVKSP
ncbi:hypothetical protein JRI60_05525 [Archangium violaceum]|uniref:hypothetical protein n=1 Tax=Archangium violaceum TaxID=83451 RepID=UPI00194FDE80|nr:hypothetical protein [Archangium violaceum]QRN98512.1 hypothetical protein JRI60_05525 [Archangium violaceum]